MNLRQKEPLSVQTNEWSKDWVSSLEKILSPKNPFKRRVSLQTTIDGDDVNDNDDSNDNYDDDDGDDNNDDDVSTLPRGFKKSLKLLSKQFLMIAHVRFGDVIVSLVLDRFQNFGLNDIWLEDIWPSDGQQKINWS